jgi:hypothetical protein
MPKDELKDDPDLVFGKDHNAEAALRHAARP